MSKRATTFDPSSFSGNTGNTGNISNPVNTSTVNTAQVPGTLSYHQSNLPNGFQATGRKLNRMHGRVRLHEKIRID